MPSNVMIRKQYVKKQPYCFSYKVRSFNDFDYGGNRSAVVCPPFDLNGCPGTSITVDWGDGTVETFTDDIFTTDYSISNSGYLVEYNGRNESVKLPDYHFYNDGLDVHIVKVYSNDFDKIYFCSLADNWLNTIEIYTPIPKVKGITYKNYNYDTRTYTGKEINSLRNLFCQGSIDFSFGAIGLKNLNAELFKNNSQITDISYCFSYCNDIEIPSDIFKYLTNIQNMDNCFDGTNDVIGDMIPATIENNELFIYSPNVNSINQMLYNAKSIAGYDSSGRTPLPEPNLKIYVPENTTTETTFTNAQFSIVYYDNSRNDENVFDCLNLTIVSLPSSMVSFEYTINTENFEISQYNYETNNYETIQVNKTGVPFSLYGAENASMTVIWGDGTHNTYTEEDYPDEYSIYFNDDIVVHTYSSIGTYKVRVFSNDFNQMDYPGDIFLFEDAAPSYNSSYYCFNNTLVSIDSKLPRLGTTVFENCFCVMNVTFPDNLFEDNPQITSFYNCFYNCYSLTSIPKDLFKYNTQVTNFGACFRSCTALTSIPKDLFKYNTQVTNFGACFDECSSLETIPEDLFKYNTQVTDFSGCFAHCTSLTSIPSNLFKYNTAVTNFNACFNGCTALTTIPADLFRYNTAVTTFINSFNWCTSLIAIPTDLFRYNTDVTSFYNCFYSCRSLTSIPEDLFKYNTEVTDFHYCFSSCSSLNDFTIHIGSSSVSNCSNFVTKKTGTTRTVYVPTGSTTETKFNAVASSYGLTIIAE